MLARSHGSASGSRSGCEQLACSEEHHHFASLCRLMADCVEKLLFADDRKFSEPLVRLTRFDARGTTSITAKTPADARIGFTEPCIG